MQLPIKIGVIGYGYWGPNLVRNFYSLQQSTVTMVADLSNENLEKVSNFYPAVRVTQDASKLIRDSQVDAVVVATPVSTHFPLAKEALLAGKHVFIEKPLAHSSEACRELIQLADSNHVVLMVDHTFVYTGAVRKMKELIADEELGQLFYFDSSRINLGLLQQDTNVIWDLATHDISILLNLVDERPTAIQANGHRHVSSSHIEMASLNLNYESGFHAQIRVSWLSPVKMRLTLLGGIKKMIVYDDVEPSDKLRVYDKGVRVDLGDEEVDAMKPIYRAGDVVIPKLDRTEALHREAQHFIDCVLGNAKPETGGSEGLAVVEVLEAAERSLRAESAFVPIEWE